METVMIKIQGVEVQASTHGHNVSSSLFVSSKEMARVARELVKKMGLKKVSVRKSSSGSLYVTLPAGTSLDTKAQVKKTLECLEGETFDGMTDMASPLDRTTDDQRRCYFGSKYVFVDIKEERG